MPGKNWRLTKYLLVGRWMDEGREEEVLVTEMENLKTGFGREESFKKVWKKPWNALTIKIKTKEKSHDFVINDFVIREPKHAGVLANRSSHIN